MNQCANTRCHAHDGELCSDGHRDRSQCHSWQVNRLEDGNSAPGPTGLMETSEVMARVPWSGSALGSDDLTHLVPRAQTILIGLLGAADAGKTTLLAVAYQHILLQGRTLGGARFAGSRSLEGWESIANSMRFLDPARHQTFPPHTPRGTGRVPGLLHVALRRPNGSFRDLLFTDAPGEWFTRWALSQDAPDTAGARWIAQYADAFLVIADSARLSGHQVGNARREVRQILERLADRVGHRPTRLVWAKHEQALPETTSQPITNILRNRIPHADQVECRHDQPETVATMLDGIINKAWDPPFAMPLQEPVIQHDPFLAFRGSHAQT